MNQSKGREPSYDKSELTDPGAGLPRSQEGMRPGQMTMEAEVTFHTRLAINLFRGRKADPSKNIYPIVGLARFAREVAGIWTASQSDDPIADMFLMRIEEAYENVNASIKQSRRKIDDLLEGMEGFDIQLQESVEPVKFKLNFFSPWAYRAAAVLKSYDQLVRAALTARHLAVLTDDEWKPIVHDAGGKPIRNLFHQVIGWKNSGLAREMINKRDTRRIKRAKKVFTEAGLPWPEIPDEVLKRELRAKLAPAIKEFNYLDVERLQRKKVAKANLPKHTERTPPTIGEVKVIADKAAEKKKRDELREKLGLSSRKSEGQSVEETTTLDTTLFGSSLHGGDKKANDAGTGSEKTTTEHAKHS